MKKLLLILILVSLGFSQAWRGMWGGEKIRIKADSTEYINVAEFEKTITDSTITNDYFLAGDTTTYPGGIVKKDNYLEIWGDTIGFMTWTEIPVGHYITAYKPWNKIYTERHDHGGALVLQGWAGGSGSVIIRTDECRPDTNDIKFFRATICPGKDTLDVWGGGPTYGYSGFGSYTKRFGTSWVLYQYQTDASKADTSKRWMGEDTLYHESENPNKFDNDMFVDGDLTADKVTTDSTIINDYFEIGDTTTADGGFVVKDNKIEVWRDTIFFSAWDPAFQEYTGKRFAKQWIEDDPGFDFYIWARSGVRILGSPWLSGNLDSTYTYFYDGSIWPAYDTLAGCASKPRVGTETNRFYAFWVRHSFITSPDKADTNYQHMEADTMYYDSENPNKFDNDVFIDGDFKITGTFENGVAVVSADFTFDGGDITIIQAQDGWVITEAFVEITTIFDGTGLVTVGDVSTADGLLTDAGINQGVVGYYGYEVNERGAYLWDNANSHARRKVYASATDLKAYVTQGTSTQGAGKVWASIMRIK
jgi:hypothetical protein